MTTYGTTIRATHLLTNAAWLGGSLMGAVALNPASRHGVDSHERAEPADAGWHRWDPVQTVAIGLHLLSGIAIVADNRHRVIARPPTMTAVVIKTALTGVAVGVSVAAFRIGAELGDTLHRADLDAGSGRKARSLAAHLKWLQWATPATTAGLLVLDADLGERQRGVAGLRDRASGCWDAHEARVRVRLRGTVPPARTHVGIRPGSPLVVVTDDELLVQFGPWRLRTALTNIASTQVSTGYAWHRTAGPAHLSLTDRGVTSATNSRRGLCLSFVDPVRAIEPAGFLRHPRIDGHCRRPRNAGPLLEPLISLTERRHDLDGPRSLPFFANPVSAPPGAGARLP